MDGDYEAARSGIEKIKDVFKEKEIYTRVVECELLTAELELMQDRNPDEFRKMYKKVLETAKAHAMEMRGPVIAESEWRIAKELVNIAD